MTPIILLLLLLAPNQLAGRVVGVSDGDTITILAEGPKGKRPVRVRLHGIDCPESHQPYGARAKQFTSRLAFGRQAVASVVDTDRYGRLVAEVAVEGRSLNRELVEAGLAWAYARYSRRYAASEQAARAARRGLWADPSPVPPWEFRRLPAKARPRASAVKAASPNCAGHASGCRGDAECTVCRDCSRCRHCHGEGNTCGACSPAGKRR